MNRNVLKIIALISMIIDHIGLVFFPEQIVFRLIGRLSFPIFAFFVAEGWYYTRSKKRYTLLMFVFMLISWVPYCMALDLPFYTVNVMGVFLLSILGMFLVDRIRLNNNKKVMYIASFCMLLLICFILEGLEIITMGVLGGSPTNCLLCVQRETYCKVYRSGSSSFGYGTYNYSNRDYSI